ncbi:MAG: glutathione S-transferase family protein [Myxococcota bacterium]|nr:glutathione S-transferase family protein [Myxococcota bacterium]
MKLYDWTPAPNPRRVRIFLAEKEMEVELVQVDVLGGEHKSEAFLAKNPSGKVPVLELDDGTHVAESVAICRTLEAMRPEPSLFGTTPFELGRIEMANRQLELEMATPIGIAWVNGPIVGRTGRFQQIPEAKAQAEGATRKFYRRLDRELGERPYMAGEQFSVADITGLCMIDFASELVALEPDRELSNLWAWHERVSARPSTKA